MRRYAVLAMVGMMVIALSACSTQTATKTESSTPAPAVGVPAPPGSPLAKVHVGMHKTQVRNILGSPSDENSYATGKAWIPFYFGNDARRTSWYYKGMGRVVFADGNVFGGGTPEVIRIDYDPTETGVAR